MPNYREMPLEGHGHYAPSIDLVETGRFVAPYLQEPAMLYLARQPIKIVPEINPVVPELQDYKLIAVNSINRHIQDKNLSRVGFNKRLDQDIDHWFESEYGILPPGVAILRYGERAEVGRLTMPQLELPEEVAKSHVLIEANSEGLIFNHVAMPDKIARLRLSKIDIEEPLAPTVPEKIDPEMRDSLLKTFSYLLNDGGAILYDSGLDIHCSSTPIDNSPFYCIDIEIERADDYPEIRPADGYNLIRVRLDPTKDGAEVYASKDNTEARVEGIRPKSYLKSQLTVRQAKELMHIALTF